MKMKLYNYFKKNKLGKNVKIIKSHISDSTLEGNNILYKNTTILHCYIGLYTYINENSFCYRTKIGKFCSIAKNVRTIAGKHPTKDFVSTNPAFFSTAFPYSFVKKQKFAEFGNPIEDNFLITIGNDVWIGESAMIMEGVKIGDGAIIGAGSLVLKNVPPYAIVAGVPAKIIKYRFSEEEINKLLEIQWWNKSIEWIKENVDLYENISMFLNSQNVL